MFAATDTLEAPWWTIESDDKRASRINVISHLLSEIRHEHEEPEKVDIPARPPATDYERPPREQHKHVPDVAATLGKKASS